LTPGMMSNVRRVSVLIRNISSRFKR
jgi:hypothetical protein